jgi:hypothetical protein
MAAPLSYCTIEDQRAVVRFLWSEGVKSAEIHRRMLAQHGACTMHQRKIYEWIERFKDGRTSITDESWPDHPSTSHTDQHIQGVDALIREDRRLMLARVAQVRLAWWRPASGADVASWTTEKLFFRRDEEARWMIPEVDHCAGELCWKVMYICSPSVELKLSRNCLYFLIHPRIMVLLCQ